MSKFSGGQSQKRVLLIKDVISGVFNYAPDEELFKTNPTSGITKRLFPKNGAQKKTVSKKDVFTKEELEQFLNTCQSDFSQFSTILGLINNLSVISNVSHSFLGKRSPDDIANTF